MNEHLHIPSSVCMGTDIFLMKLVQCDENTSIH
jgi:hypothetical protein